MEFTDLSKHGDYSDVVEREVFKLMEPEAVAVDDDRDAGDLGLGLECNDGQDFVDEGEKLERVLNLTVGLMSTVNSGNMMRLLLILFSIRKVTV